MKSFQEFERESKRSFRRVAFGAGALMLASIAVAIWFGLRQEEKCEASGGAYSWRLDLCIPGAAK